MPFKKRRRYRRNNRAKWRQQKLAVGTVQKIAKRVAIYQMQKKEEPKFTLLTIGSFPQDAAPIGDMLTMRGRYEGTSGLYLNNDMFHPFTVRPPVITTGAVQTVDSGRGTRIGDTVNLTGIALKGTLVFPKEIDHGVRVSISIYRADSVLSQDLYKYEFDLNNETNTRMIDDSEKIHKVAQKSWLLNHTSGSQTIKRNVSMYIKFKNGKRIRYNEDLVHAQGCSLLDFQDTRYLCSMRSDVNGPAIFSDPVNANTRNAYPQFYGKWVCYYRDS